MKSLSLCGMMMFSMIVMCTSGNLRKQFEGIDGENFRVYVRIDNYDLPEKITDEEIDKMLIDKGRRRFTALMKGIALTNKNNRDEFVKAADNQYPVKIYNRKDRENYIEAFVDYKLDKPLIDLYRTEYPEVKKENASDE